MTTPSISVVVPVHNEEENILPLLAEINASLKDMPAFEAVYVEDGSSDQTWNKLQEAQKLYPWLKVVRHKRAYGQSIAVVTGVKAASAPIIATLDGDGQNDPADIPLMLQKLKESREPEKTLIAGFRHKRRDTFSKRVQSRLANRIRSRILGDDTPDSGCGIKLFYRELFLSLPHFNHMHRFLPALVKSKNGLVVSYPVNHRERTRGVSKYGFWGRLAAGIVDMLGVLWLRKRASAPEIEK